MAAAAEEWTHLAAVEGPRLEGETTPLNQQLGDADDALPLFQK